LSCAMFDHFQNMFGLRKTQVGKCQCENTGFRLFGKKKFLDFTCDFTI